jgi:arylsulfatase A-like enzyme
MEKRPNILIFMTDQQRGGTVLPGSRLKAITPNLDRFRAQGVTFAEAHCPSPHCCPSRATFFTGLYPSQHGVWNNVTVPNALSRGLNPAVRLWSEDLRGGGYDLYFSGKWHVSATETPADRGWNTRKRRHDEPAPPCDEADIGAAAVRRDWAHYAAHTGMDLSGSRGEGEVRRPGYDRYVHYGEHPDKFGDREVVLDAAAALPRLAAGGAPWCLYVGTLGPHDPYFVPPEYLELYPSDSIELPRNFTDRMADKPALYRRTRGVFDQLSEREHREALRHYLAFCTFQDALFGELLSALDATGQADNTVVLFCSDHGDYAGDHGLWAKGLPCFRGAYHIPLIVRDPRAGAAKPGLTVDALVSLADIGPTIADWAGTLPPEESPGRSLLPLLRGEVPADWRDAVFTQSNGNELYGIQRAVTTKDWKFIHNGFDFDEFYHLREDPAEMVNRIDDPAMAKWADEGMRRIWEFAHAVSDHNTNGYIMVGLARQGPGSAFRKPG